MSKETPPPVAAAAAASSNDNDDTPIHGSDIAQVLTSQGPVVTCVLLRHMRSSAKDVHPHVASTSVDETHKRQVLTELVEELQVDTTPSKNAIKDILGPFTFIGQFPTEGVVAMARKELPEDDLSTLGIAKLRELCQEADIDTSAMLEKNELVTALQESQLPVNPHKLQPPLDELVVRGDILLLKVAETDEVLDNDDNGPEKEMKVLSNEEFFLNYTKEEYIAFASRTDVVAPEVEDDDDDDDERKPAAEDDDDDDDDEEDEDFDPAGDGDPDEEEKHAMLNLIMAEVLRKFREDKGRGPNSEELLEIRKQVAEPLGIDVTTVTDLEAKRSAEHADGEERSPKRVKFTGGEETATGDDEADDDEEDEDEKPAATNDTEEKAE